MKKPTYPNETDSLEALRDAMITRRNESMKNWPDGINDTVLFSHVIAALYFTMQLRDFVESIPGESKQTAEIIEEEIL